MPFPQSNFWDIDETIDDGGSVDRSVNQQLCLHLAYFSV